MTKRRGGTAFGAGSTPVREDAPARSPPLRHPGLVPGSIVPRTPRRGAARHGGCRVEPGMTKRRGGTAFGAGSTPVREDAPARSPRLRHPGLVPGSIVPRTRRCGEARHGGCRVEPGMTKRRGGTAFGAGSPPAREGAHARSPPLRHPGLVPGSIVPRTRRRGEARHGGCRVEPGMTKRRGGTAFGAGSLRAKTHLPGRRHCVTPASCRGPSRREPEGVGRRGTVDAGSSPA